MTRLNEKLLKEKNISKSNREAIEELHQQLEVLAVESENENLSDEEYKQIGDSVETIEFALQELWGFNKDIAFHRHYMKLHGCTCGNIDNKEDYGYRRHKSGACKYHG